MTKVRVFDMLGSANKKDLGAGKNYGVSNIAALPSDFTTDFTSVAVTDGNNSNSPQKDMKDSLYLTVQVLTTAITAGTATVKLQRSNIGGTSADVWEDVPGAAATVSVTTTGSKFLDFNTSLVRSANFVRANIAITGGDITCYLVGWSYANS